VLTKSFILLVLKLVQHVMMVSSWEVMEYVLLVFLDVRLVLTLLLVLSVILVCSYQIIFVILLVLVLNKLLPMVTNVKTVLIIDLEISLEVFVLKHVIH